MADTQTVQMVSVIDKIEILEDGTVQVRSARYFVSDAGERLGSPPDKFHRVVHQPGDDISDANPKVQAQAAAAWTDEVIQSYQAKKAAVAATQG